MKLASIAAMMLALSACAPTIPTPAMTASRSTPLDPETLSLSCSELQTRNNRIAARLQELERQSKVTARQNAVTDAVVGVGLTALLGAGAQGGLSGIRAASAATQGIDAVRSAERGQLSMQSVSDTLALAGRSSQIQRAMIEKGCS